MCTFFLRSLFLFFFTFAFQHLSYATHIIGGEILMSWTGSGNIYQVTLNKYSNANSSGFVTDLIETVYFYQKGTDYKVGQLNLQLISNNPVNSNANYCADPTLLRTQLQVYSYTIDLTGLDRFGTYYVTWDECCRNQDIVNLTDPMSEWSTFYTEFMGWGQRDSSPKFVPLANEFFCRNTLNFFDLSATDADGDELVYSLVSPRSSVNPSIDVVWSFGSSYTNPIPGSVPFTINSSTGIASFNPWSNGIYVFGIKVEEYRNGQKIGEVRKDFQLNVIDCPTNNKPVIAFQNRAVRDGDTLTVPLKGSTCFPLYITDVDATRFISEMIYVTTRSGLPANSKKPYPAAGFSIPAQVPLSGFRDTMRFNACFNPCSGGLKLDETSYYPFEVIINDDRCPAKYDTLIFTIKVEVSTNNVPEVFIDPPTNPKTVKVNEQVLFKVYGTDADDSDVLTLTIMNPQPGMHFRNVADSSSTISSMFSWQPDCSNLNPGKYNVSFIIKDNSCVVNSADTVRQTIIVEQDDVSFEGMQVTNLITPNGDGLNDYYHIPGIPEGNCDKYFKGIEIYNRWGSRVFYSQDPAFKWYPDVSDGLYYFSIDLNYEVQKGWLQITQ